MKQEKNNEGRLDALTSLRFFAAFVVFLWHTQFLHSLQLGYAGVGFFYILSGFILTYVYYSKLRHGSSNIKQVKKFYIARIAKLYPVHILTFIAALPLFIPIAQSLFPDHTTAFFGAMALSNLSLTQSWVPSNDVNFSFNGVAWSISVEMFFYLLFPLAIFLITKYRRFFTIRRTLITMIFLWTFLALSFVSIDAVVDQWNLYILPLVRLPDFIMGVLLGMIFIQLKDGAITQKVFNKVRSWTVLELAVIASLVVGVIIGTIMPQSLRFAIWLMPFWVVLIIVFSQQKGVVSKALQWKPLIFLGEASFSFYMVHQLIIRYVAELGLSKIPVAIISLVIAVTASSLIYLYFEEPSRIRLKKFLEKQFIRTKEEVAPEATIAVDE